MILQQEGTIFEMYDVQQVSEKFKKREFILEITGQYPEYAKFQLVQDKCSLIDGFRLGDTVKVSFSLRGRGAVKDGLMIYYSNLDAWKIEATGNTPQPRPRVPAGRVQEPVTAGGAAPIKNDDDNDLPF